MVYWIGTGIFIFMTLERCDGVSKTGFFVVEVNNSLDLVFINGH